MAWPRPSLISKMQIFEEALLEPLARWVRFHQGHKFIPTDKPLQIVDLGCGPQLRFYHFANKRGIKIRHYTGVDPLVNNALVTKFKNHSQITIVNRPLVKKISLKSNSADLVVAFAFFEHIDHPKEILAEAYRLLNPGGKIILTVPSVRAKAVLEFLSFKLNLISKREIEEHQQYFDQQSLMKLLPKGINWQQVKHSYFELGMNNLFVIEKTI
jgi:ubiquinone/menaquinone biosynthesis C-methylase UbiE